MESLHGAVAVNAFISIINPEIDAGCPFCTERETIFHAFVNCTRLKPLFLYLDSIFRNCNESFYMVLFIFGFKYVMKKRFICKFLNFVLGQAKLAIYVSRKKKSGTQFGTESSYLVLEHGASKNTD